LVEKLGELWVSARDHSWVGGQQQDMVVGKREDGIKIPLHMFVDIGVHHT